MSDEVFPEAVQTQQSLSDLSIIMYGALEAGVAHAAAYFEDRTRDPWLFSHLVRYQAREVLRLKSMPGLRIVDHPMSGIEVWYKGHSLRVWKKPDEEGEFIQPTGESDKRQDFVAQRQIMIPEVEEYCRQRGLFSSEKRTNLVYVWEPTSNGILLWLVCPDGFEDIWEPGLFRWEIGIPHPALAMSTEQDFAEDEDLVLHLDDSGERRTS